MAKLMQSGRFVTRGFVVRFWERRLRRCSRKGLGGWCWMGFRVSEISLTTLNAQLISLWARIIDAEHYTSSLWEWGYSTLTDNNGNPLPPALNQLTSTYKIVPSQPSTKNSSSLAPKPVPPAAPSPRTPPTTPSPKPNARQWCKSRSSGCCISYMGSRWR